MKLRDEVEVSIDVELESPLTWNWGAGDDVEFGVHIELRDEVELAIDIELRDRVDLPFV